MSKAKVFVIMPFSEDFFESYEMIKQHFEEGFEFSHAGEEDNQQNILADIVPPIYNADIVLADLTGLNPNVMYELGIAHSLNKKTVVITRDDLSKLPFDLKQYRAKGYSTHFKQFFDLITYLEKQFTGATDGSVIFSNPVIDFLDKNQLDPMKLFNNKASSADSPEDEKGFVDFLAEIEEDSEEMAQNIQTISVELQELDTGMKKSTAEMTRVQQIGGSGVAAHTRKQAKKIAELMEAFSSKLKRHNENNTVLWDRIEKNVLGLLENQYAATDTNKASLIEYLKSLYRLRGSVAFSANEVNSTKEIIHSGMGLQRSLNKAIQFMVEDMGNYSAWCAQIIASIERILGKSKFVVGEIDFSTEEAVDNA